MEKYYDKHDGDNLAFIVNSEPIENEPELVSNLCTAPQQFLRSLQGWLKSVVQLEMPTGRVKTPEVLKRIGEKITETLAWRMTHLVTTKLPLGTARRTVA